MPTYLRTLAWLSAAAGLVSAFFLFSSNQMATAVMMAISGLVTAALLGGFAEALDTLGQILARTPEVPGKIESTWVNMLPDWRVGSVSQAGGGYHALCHKKGEEPIFLETDGTRRLFQTRDGAHQEAEAFLRALK